MAVNSASGFRSLHPSVGQVASSGSRLPAAIELGDGGKRLLSGSKVQAVLQNRFFLQGKTM